MCQNKLIVAAAGSGKTTHIVSEALSNREANILITTYTQANQDEILKKIIKKNGCVPSNVTVQTWFSFLLRHGVRPYQGKLTEKKITGLLLMNTLSGVKYYYKGRPIFFSEEREFERHYFSKEMKIYSDKLSKFVFRCNEINDGVVIDRLSRIYTHIYVDEVQDLAGYDLELLKLLFASQISMSLVGDPRQATYSTNSSAKNKQFKRSGIIEFFEDDSLNLEIDSTSLTTNHRSVPDICLLSDKIFPELQTTASGNDKKTGHDGVFLVKKEDIRKYLEKFEPIQLRDNRTKTVFPGFSVMNFGESKGLSFDRVLIYPTGPMVSWFKNNNTELRPISRAKFYVAITRARYSVGIECELDESMVDGDDITIWNSED